MNKVDVSKWKSFRYDEVFIIRKGYYNKKPEHLSGAGNVPFVGATQNNNGITDLFTLEEISIFDRAGSMNPDNIDKKIFKGNCITVSNNGSVGYAFYQREDFTCSHDVNPLYLINGKLSPNIAMFLITIIEADQYRWSYGRKWRPIRMPSSKILLPVDSLGNPDFEYMENYVKLLWKEDVSEKPIKEGVPILNTSNWKRFKYNYIFDIKKGKRLTKAEMNVGGTPYIGAIENNNGVRQYIDIVPPHRGNAITVNYNGSVGKAFYQSEPFWASDDVNILYPNTKNCPEFNMNAYVSLFLIPLIEKETYRFNYGRKWKVERMEQSDILLPVKLDGSPDFNFMENYIKSMPFSSSI